jgi:phosphoglycerate kinase
MNLPSLDTQDITEGMRVLVRVDFNEPVQDGEVQDDYRIRQSMQTIQALRERGAKIILISHFKGTPENSLRPVADYINDKFCSVRFVKECVGDDAKEAINQMAPSDVVLLENLRQHSEEEANDETFAKRLAEHGDLFVNEAFSVSHRKHASVVGVPTHLPSVAGHRLRKEVKELSEVFDPPHPFVFILGGAKFETKVPLIRKFADRADLVFVGGAIANELYRQRGLSVGDSLVPETSFDLSDVLEKGNVETPQEVITNFNRRASVEKIGDNESILDAAPSSLDSLSESLKHAAPIVWNGPLGDYEKGYTKGTLELAKMIANAPVRSIVGGGDTLTAIEELNILDRFSFVSTGGGAMLSFLANEDLPGLKALR